MKTPAWIRTSFWNGFGSINQLFPPYTCCWSRVGLTVGVSTATCEASFSSVMRILTHTLSQVHDTRPYRGNEVRQRPGQEASLAPPCSNLISLGSKCTALKEVLVTLFGLFGARSHSALPIVIRRPGYYAHLAPPLVTPLRPYKCQLVLLGFEKNETAAVANEDIVSEFSTKTRRLHVWSILLTLQVPPWILFIYYAM